MAVLLLGTLLAFGDSPAWLETRSLSVFEPAGTGEISGVCVGRRQPGLLWVHDDSGGQPELRAHDRTGRRIATVRLRGAAAFDWEDVASGYDPEDGASLFVGDIGDNFALRPFVTLYRLEEPLVTRDASDFTVEALAIPARYEDGPRDAETLLVDPVTGNVWIVPTSPRAGLYRLISTNGGVMNRLVRAAELPWPESLSSARISGGDISPDGSCLVLVTSRGEGVEFHLERPHPGELRLSEPRRLSSLGENGTEAIAYGIHGGSLLLLREGGKPPLLEVPSLESTAHSFVLR